MKKILFISFLMALSAFAKAKPSLPKLEGYWLCTTSIAFEEYNLLEIYRLNLKSNFKVDQKGAIHFTNAEEEALLNYESSSDWSLNRNILSFKNLKANKYSINNEMFQKKYKVLDIFSDSPYEDTYSYEIQKLTDDELVLYANNDEFEWLSLTVNCFRT
jgi:hypothetical protein